MKQIKGSDSPCRESNFFRWLGIFFAIFLFSGILPVCVCEVSAQDQAVRFNRSNSAFVDNYVNRIVLFNGMPVVCTESGITIVQIDHLETWRRGESGFPDAGVKSAVVYGGKLWVGTYGKGLARLEEGKWKSFTTQDSGLNDNFITNLAVFGGKLFIGTRDGLAIFDGLLWERVKFNVAGPVYVAALTIHRNGVWAGTNHGVFSIGAGNRPDEVDLGVTQPGRVSAMDSFGGVIFISFEGGIAAIRPDGKKVFWGADKLPSAKIFDIVGVENGAICASEMGLFRISLDGGVQKVDLKGIGETPSMSVTAIVRGGGFLWLGIEGGGIVRLQDQLENFANLSGRDSASLANQSNDVRPFPGAPSSGNIPRTTTSTNVEGFRVTDVQIFPPPEEKGPSTSPVPGTSSGNPPTVQPVSGSGGIPNIPGWGGAQPVPQPVSAGRTTPSPVEIPARVSINESGLPNIPGYSSGGQKAIAAIPTAGIPQTQTTSTPGSNQGPSIPGWSSSGSPGGNVENKQFIPPPVQGSQPGGNPPLIPGWGKPANADGGSNPLSTPTGLSFARDIAPLLSRNCVPCHTTGTGSFFPMNNFGNLVSYFKKEGLMRFEQARSLGRGMSGKVSQADSDLLKAWVSAGTRE